jgi:hypothetical protein
MIYGFGEYVCSICKEAGWYSTAGWGGETHHKNRITGKSKLINEKITIEKPCICDIKGFKGSVKCNRCGFSEEIMMNKMLREERCLVHRKGENIEYVCLECTEGVIRECTNNPKSDKDGKKCTCELEIIQCGSQCMNCFNYFLRSTTREELKERCEIHGKGDEFVSRSLCDECEAEWKRIANGEMI